MKILERSMRLQVIALGAIALAGTPASAYNKERLLSPSLPVLQGRHLSIRLLKGWSINERDLRREWSTSSYNFSVAIPVTRTTSKKRHREIILSMQILQWPRSRAERHGMLQGKTLRSQSSLAGILTKKLFSNKECPYAVDQSEYYTIPVKQGAVIVLRASYPYKQRHTISPMAHTLFRRICFQ